MKEHVLALQQAHRPVLLVIIHAKVVVIPHAQGLLQVLLRALDVRGTVIIHAGIIVQRVAKTTAHTVVLQHVPMIVQVVVQADALAHVLGRVLQHVQGLVILLVKERVLEVVV